ncbi:MAG: hypothetical protein JXX14_07910 [Deltaproteobacteria bacterium]|nr:hypothetical protein [Deltaproteobacteria bacterium]
MVALGMAVGTGNIWRFPRDLAQNGSVAFIIAWLIFYSRGQSPSSLPNALWVETPEKEVSALP